MSENVPHPDDFKQKFCSGPSYHGDKAILGKNTATLLTVDTLNSTWPTNLASWYTRQVQVVH